MFLLIAAGSAFIGFIGRAWWMFEMFSNFYQQYWWFFVVLTAVFLIGKKFKWASISFALLVVTSLMVGTVYLGGMRQESQPRDLRVMFNNVYFGNSDTQRIAHYIKQEQPDIIALAEVNYALYTELAKLLPEYPHQFYQEGAGPYELALFSKVPIENERAFFVGNHGIPTIRADVVVNERMMALYVIHPPWPMGSHYAQHRNDYLSYISNTALSENTPVLVIGDFNTTPWSPYFRDVLKSGLYDSRQGFGIQTSWPAFLPAFLRIPLDHALYRGLTIVNREVGTSTGSDHLPVIVDLKIN